MGERPTGTVTFLFTDIEGSTRLWERHPQSMKAALREHDRILHTTIETAGGHVFSTAGDAFSAAFERPGSAVEAAAAAQSGLLNITVDNDPVRVRMAIHTGTADERDGDYFGPALNRTARLLSAGHGSQILTSLATRELVHDSLPEGWRLRDLGNHRLKDLSRPEQVFQLTHPDLPGRFPPLATIGDHPNNLPIQLTSFIGREREEAEVARLVRDGSRMVTLVGVGGGGKTRLALQAAADMLFDFSDGCWLVELAQLTDPTLIPSEVARAVGLQERPDEDLAAALTEWCRDKRLLLILDNCEHLVDGTARFSERLLRKGTGVTILATSREVLGVPGEIPYQVPPLAVPIDDTGSSSSYPAVRLFIERAEQAKPGFRITDDNEDAIVQICGRLDGLPLAIELAAARLRMMSARQIADRLDDRFRLLTGGTRTAVPRQQTLEAAMGWSFDLLSEHEKVLFTRLSVFSGGFTLDAAENVCGVDPLPTDSVLDLVGNLVDKSLIQTEDRLRGVRYRTLETLRQFALTRLEDSDELQALRRRHANYFRGLSEHAEPHLRGPEEDMWLARLDDELDNLRQAIDWAVKAGEGELAQATVGALYHYFAYRFRLTEGREWAESALEVSDEPAEARVKALLTAGGLAGGHMDDETAQRHLDEALDLARAMNAEILLPALLIIRGSVSRAMGRSKEAEHAWLQAHELARRLDQKGNVSRSLFNLSKIARDRADFDLSAAQTAEALEMAEALGSERLMDDARGALQWSLRLAGRFDEAEKILEAMVESEKQRGAAFHPGRAAADMAVLAWDRGDYQRASDLLLQGLREFSTIRDADRDVWMSQWFLHRTASVLAHFGDHEAAATMLGASDAVAKGFVRPAEERREVEPTRATVKDGLSDFQAHYDAGKQMSTRDALVSSVVGLENITTRNES